MVIDVIDLLREFMAEHMVGHSDESSTSEESTEPDWD
jgi:hypothetical protein